MIQQPHSWAHIQWRWKFQFENMYACQLEKGMTTHSSILAGKNPWTKEPGGLQSKDSQRVGHDWSDWTSMHPSVHSITIYNTHDMEATCLPQQKNGWRRCSIYKQWNIQFSSVQSLIHVRLFVTPWIAARQASLSITNSWINHKKWNNAATLMDLGNTIWSEISDIWRKTNIVSHVYSRKNTNKLINVFTK